jgi:hypothetical protein
MVHLDPVSRQRLQRGATHLHTLGPRAVAEFLAELGRREGTMPQCLNLLAEYQSRLTPSLVRAAGGDRFPPRPLLVVGGGI